MHLITILYYITHHIVCRHIQDLMRAGRPERLSFLLLLTIVFIYILTNIYGFRLHFVVKSL